MTASICMEELSHSLGSLAKIGRTSDSSALLLASLLPPLLELKRADAASRGVNSCEGFSSETSLIPGESILQRARGFSLNFSERRIDLIVCEMQ